MSQARWVISAVVVASVFGTADALRPALGAQDVSTPNFAPSPDVGWVSYGPEFIPPASGPRPVAADPAHPFIANAVEYRAGQPDVTFPDRQPTFPVADLTNPILQPWAREELRKLNEIVLSGKPVFEKRTGCWPSGVPAYNLYVVLPTYFIQTPTKIVMISQQDHQVRHIYLNVPHSANPAPSWNGESVGHYEGDTLVVDTIGMNDRTFVDNFRTPHTTQLHVVERFRMIDGGGRMEVHITVDDPGAYTTTWTAIQRFRRFDSTDPFFVGGLIEYRCAENNVAHFNFDIEPIPTADTPDF
jgi:hypothetical protein